jgi:hypothetical protein
MPISHAKLAESGIGSQGLRIGAPLATIKRWSLLHLMVV